MMAGLPSNPWFDAAVDPRLSDTDKTIVRLYPSCSEPGGIVVLRVVDTDVEDVSQFTVSESLINVSVFTRKFQRPRAWWSWSVVFSTTNVLESPNDVMIAAQPQLRKYR